MRQRTKLGLALLVLALVLSVVVVGGVELFRQQAQQQAQADIRQTARTVSNQTADEIRTELQGLQRLSTEPGISQRTAIDRNLEGFTSHSQFNIAVFVAPNGTILEARGIRPELRNETIGSNVSDDPYIERALRSDGQAEVGSPVRDPDLGEYVVPAAYTVTADGEIVGVVAGSIPVSAVSGSVQAVDTDGRTAQLSAWNGSAQVLLREPAGRGFDETLTANATVSVPGTNWLVTIIADQAPLNERLDELTIIQFGGLFVVFLAVMALGYWEYTTNLKQTDRLLEGFRALREGDYGYTVSLTSATEWQRVSEGYNDLTRGLAEREQAIREHEQQLEVLNRVLRHNLQNDMNVIIGHAEMLPRFSDDDRVADAADTIIRMGEELVGHGQKARQLESVMGQDVTVTTLDVAAVVEGVVESYRRVYPAVTFEVKAPDHAAASAIETFEVAIDNLVENAAEHNDNEDPVVTVAVESGPDSVSIEVRDNGPGIPDHEREVLDTGAESALKHGSGLGLWVTFWVVDRSGGTLSFADRAPRGSVVTIDLPTGSEPPENASPLPSDVEESTADD